MSCKSSFFLVLSAASLCYACSPIDGETPEDQGEEEQVAEARHAIAVNNAEQMNGSVLNSTFLNGVKFNGVKFNGVKFNGVKFNGTDLEGTREDNGITVSGAGFDDTDIDAELGDSTATTLRVASATTGEVAGFVTYELTDGPGGSNVCASGGKALLLPGVWDYATGQLNDDSARFTVACRGAAIAKCAEWGYNEFGSWSETHNSQTNVISLKYFHQACVRMVRADYCGNGVSHTVTGTSIDIWDAKGINEESDPLPAGMTFEAEWSASGATCVSHPRYTTSASGDVQDYIENTAGCNAVWQQAGCGGAGSKFFTANGFNESPATRPFLRNASDEQ